MRFVLIENFFVNDYKKFIFGLGVRKDPPALYSFSFFNFFFVQLQLQWGNSLKVWKWQQVLSGDSKAGKIKRLSLTREVK